MGTHSSQGLGAEPPGRVNTHLVGDKTLMVGVPGAFSGFFAPGFPKLARFQRHHDIIMEKELKGLKKHLVSRRSPEAQHHRPGQGYGTCRTLPMLPRARCPALSPPGPRAPSGPSGEVGCVHLAAGVA